MKKLFSGLLLTGLLLSTGCAHKMKCSGQCDVKSAEKKCCCSEKKAQCDVKKEEKKKS